MSSVFIVKTAFVADKNTKLSNTFKCVGVFLPSPTKRNECNIVCRYSIASVCVSCVMNIFHNFFCNPHEKTQKRIKSFVLYRKVLIILEIYDIIYNI